MSRCLCGDLHMLDRLVLQPFLLPLHVFLIDLRLALLIKYYVHVLHEHREHLEVLHGQQILEAVKDVGLGEEAVVGEEVPERGEDGAEFDMAAHDGGCQDLHDQLLVVAEDLQTLLHLFTLDGLLVRSEDQTVGLDEGLDWHLPVTLRLEKFQEVIHM
jgi:hypothetical protein